MTKSEHLRSELNFLADAMKVKVDKIRHDLNTVEGNLEDLRHKEVLHATRKMVDALYDCFVQLTKVNLPEFGPVAEVITSTATMVGSLLALVDRGPFHIMLWVLRASRGLADISDMPVMTAFAIYQKELQETMQDLQKDSGDFESKLFKLEK